MTRMNGLHIDAEKYARDLRLGIEDADARKHLATCESCQAALAAISNGQATNTPRTIPTTAMAFLNNLARSGLSLLFPPFRKSVLERPVPPPSPAIPEKMTEPLRVLLPRGQRFFQNPSGKLLVIACLTTLTLVAPMPPGLQGEAQRAIAAFVFTGSILALEPISLPLAALMVPVILVGLGLGSVTESFETFSRPVVFLILASLFLAEALGKYGITKRLALRTILASGGDVRKLLLGIMGIAAFLSMWVENTATAAVLIPVALTIARQVPDQKEARRLLVLLVLGIAYSASLGGMVTIMGSASNAVASGFLAQIQPWSFLDWSKYALPPFLFIFPLTWWILLKILPLSVSRIDIEQARTSFEKLGRMTATEIELVVTMAVAVLFWVVGAEIESALGLPATLLSSSVIAVTAVLYLACRQLITWNDIKNVSWGIFLIIGAGLALGEALNRSGATDWMAGAIAPVIVGPPLLVSLLFVVFLSALLTNILNNTTIAAVLVPVLISVAAANPEVSAIQLVLPVTLATTFGYSLPSASGRMALIGASGIITAGEMLRFGLVVTFFSSIVLALVFYGYSLMGWI